MAKYQIYRDMYNYLDVVSALNNDAFVLAHFLEFGEVSCYNEEESEECGIFRGPSPFDADDAFYAAAEALLNGKVVRALKLVSARTREWLNVAGGPKRYAVRNKRRVSAQRRRVSRAAAAIAAGTCIWRDANLEERMLRDADDNFGIPLYVQADTMRQYYKVRQDLGIAEWWCHELSAIVDYVLTGYKTLAFEDGFESADGFYDWTSPCGGWAVDLCSVAVFFAVCCGKMDEAENVFRSLPNFWTGKSAGHITVQEGIQRLHEVVESPKCWMSYKHRSGSYYLVA